MAYQNSPRIVTNGLVACYDTYNAKSYIGEPTTNLVNPSWSAWGLDSSGYSTGGTRTITSGNSYECTIVDSGSNTRQSISTNASANTTYTFSVLYKKLYGAPTLRFQLQAWNSGSYVSTMIFATTAQLGVTDIDGWQRAQISVTTPANCNSVLWFMQDGDDYTGYTHAFMLANPQMEQKSHATPFTPSTRSNANSLVDLTRTNSFNLSAAGFDSGANILFSGSQYIVGGTPTLASSSSSPFTLLAWCKPTNLTSWQTVLGTNGTYRQIGWNGATFYFGGNTGSGSFISGGSGSNNNWYFLGMAYTGSTAYGYKNGVPVGSGTIGSPANSNGINVIGSYYTGGAEFFQGYIPIAMVYNRSLNEYEILQNYNATKSRFGL